MNPGIIFHLRVQRLRLFDLFAVPVIRKHGHTTAFGPFDSLLPNEEFLFL